MSKIPYSDETAQIVPDQIADTTLHVEPTAGAFGGDVGEALSTLGSVLNQRQQQVDAHSVNVSLNKFQSGMHALQYGSADTAQEPGFMSLRGSDALDAWPAVEQQLRHLQQQSAASLTSAAQRNRFNDDSKALIDAAMNRIAGHAARERDAYHQLEAERSIDQAHDIAAQNYRNPDVVQSSLLRSQNTVADLLRSRGIRDNDNLMRTALSQDRDHFFRNLAETIAGNGNPAEARSLLDANRKNISDPAYDRLSRYLSPLEDKAHAMALVAGAAATNGRDVPLGIPGNANPDMVWNSIIRAESGNHQFNAQGGPLSSTVAQDTPVGVSQIRPSTAKIVAQSQGIAFDPQRLRNDKAYNEALGRAYYDQLLTRYGHNHTLAAAAYNAGPGNVDRWITKSGDPRTGHTSDTQFTANIPFEETRRYVSGIAAQNGARANSGNYDEPNLDAQIKHISQAGQSLPATAVRQAVILAHSNYNNQQSATAISRRAMEHRMSVLSDLYGEGKTDSAVPSGEIRSLYPAPEAENMIRNLEARKQAGDVFAALKWAAPSRMDEHDLKSLSASATDDDDRGRGHLAQMMQTRENALRSDPAAYVAGHPVLQQLAQHREFQNDKQLQSQYRDANIAIQRQIGVMQPRSFTADEAHAVVEKIHQDAAKGISVQQSLDNIKSLYGAANSEPALTIHELRIHGGLRPDYAMLGTMRDPATRGDFERAIASGSLAQMRSAAGGGAANLHDPETGIDHVMHAYKDATARLKNGSEDYADMRRHVERLALHYMASHGLEPEIALKKSHAALVPQHD